MEQPDIPKTCKAGVVVNPGPGFHLEVQDVDVPEPGTSLPTQHLKPMGNVDFKHRPERSPSQTQLHRPMYVGCTLHAERPATTGADGSNWRPKSWA